MLNLESVERPDPAYIRSMFDRMARRYDAFTFWMSLGGAGAMRSEALKDLRPGDRVLDVACGTGDLALEAARRTGAKGRVVGLDFSPGMIEVAKLRHARMAEAGKQPPAGRSAGPLARLDWVCQGAETLPIAGEKFDWVVSGFALRGLYEHIDPILDGIRRSLDANGQISLLDLTEPRNPALKWLYKTFFYSWVALLGALLFGKDYPVAYLPDSSSRFLKASEFVEKLKSKGFRDVTARSFIFGSVTLYRAKK